MNGKRRGTLTVPLELTKPKNHTRLQEKVVLQAREKNVLQNDVTVDKVIIASRANLVNIVTTNS